MLAYVTTLILTLDSGVLVWLAIRSSNSKPILKAKMGKIKKIKAAQPIRPKQNKQAAKKPAWSKVKIAGSLVTDDGGGLEGLIGLEILENYDKDVITSKVRSSICHALFCI